MTKELEEKLEALQEGEKIVLMDENGDEVMYIKPRIPKPCDEHEFQDVGNYEQICIRCGNGRVLARL